MRRRHKKFAVFISHHKKDAAEVANTLWRFFTTELRVPSFLDVKDLRNLADLREDVRNSCVVLALQSSEYLFRPWCLVELFEAIQSKRYPHYPRPSRRQRIQL